MTGTRGSARMLRCPRARGPNSMRPWNQPTTWPRAIHPARARQGPLATSRKARLARAGPAGRLDPVGRAQAGGGHGGPRRPVSAWWRYNAAPSEPPASRPALDEEVGEGRLLGDPAGGRDVEAAPAREAEAGKGDPAVQVAGDAQERLLEEPLERGRHVWWWAVMVDRARGPVRTPEEGPAYIRSPSTMPNQAGSRWNEPSSLRWQNSRNWSRNTGFPKSARAMTLPSP